MNLNLAFRLLLVGAILSLSQIGWSQDQKLGPDGGARESARAQLAQRLNGFASSSSEALSLVAWLNTLTLITLNFKDDHATIARIHESDVQTDAMLLVTIGSDKNYSSLEALFAPGVTGGIKQLSGAKEELPRPILTLRGDYALAGTLQDLDQLRLIYDCKVRVEKNDINLAKIQSEEFMLREMKRLAGSTYADVFKKMKQEMEADRVKERRPLGDYRILSNFSDLVKPAARVITGIVTDLDLEVLRKHFFIAVSFEGIDERHKEPAVRQTLKQQLVGNLTLSD